MGKHFLLFFFYGSLNLLKDLTLKRVLSAIFNSKSATKKSGDKNKIRVNKNLFLMS